VSARRFPVLRSHLRGLECPASVPWALVEPHAARARLNHDQSLERLAERGGLSPAELWCVVNDRHWRESPSEPEAVAWLRSATGEEARDVGARHGR
jgi:hypothetical protein